MAEMVDSVGWHFDILTGGNETLAVAPAIGGTRLERAILVEQERRRDVEVLAERQQ